MTPDAAWKRHERETAKRLGGKRTGPLGKESVDVAHEIFSIECKERKTLPAWILAAMAQAKGNAKKGQLPIAVIHRLGDRHDKDLVCMSFKDFTDWYGEMNIDLDPPAMPPKSSFTVKGRIGEVRKGKPVIIEEHTPL